MAPSRAAHSLYRSCSAAAHLRPSPRLLSSCSVSSGQLALPICPHRSRRPTASRTPTTSRFNPAFSRPYSSTVAPEPPDYLNERELQIFNKIKAELEPVRLEVQDISGGCGSMYALEIESPRFQGLTVIKQHKMVNEVLKEEIKGWHGVQLRTKPA